MYIGWTWPCVDSKGSLWSDFFLHVYRLDKPRRDIRGSLWNKFSSSI
jgi:hypothetical protein